jgi:hypothetical protein
MSNELIVNNAELTAVPNSEELESILTEFGSMGQAKDFSQIQLPFISALQPMSPQVNKREVGSYIEGAEPGILFNTVTRELYNSETNPCIVIPIEMITRFVEWVPRNKGGGFVASYEKRPKGLTEMIDDATKKRQIVTKDGNVLVETIYHLVIEEKTASPAIISCSSTNMRSSRTWLTHRGRIQHNGRPTPAFMRRWEVGTAYNSGQAGNWFTFVFHDRGWVNDRALLEKLIAIARDIKNNGFEVTRPPSDLDEEELIAENIAKSGGAEIPF